MKLPIRVLPKTVPPQFEYYSIVELPQGGQQAVKYSSCVAPSMERALCDLIRIAQQLATENEKLRESAEVGVN